MTRRVFTRLAPVGAVGVFCLLAGRALIGQAPPPPPPPPPPAAVAGATAPPAAGPVIPPPPAPIDPAAPLPSEEFASFHHFSLALHSSRGERDFFLTVVLNQLGYVSLALDFLRSASFPPDRIEALLRATARVEPEPRWKRALRSHLPPSVYRGLKRLNRRLRYRS